MKINDYLMIIFINDKISNTYMYNIQISYHHILRVTNLV